MKALSEIRARLDDMPSDEIIQQAPKYIARLLAALEKCMEQRDSYMGADFATHEDECNAELEAILNGENPEGE